MFLEKTIKEMYKKMMYSRCDDTQTLYYFKAEDFVGLQKEEYNFKSSLTHDLKGYIYQYENPISNRIIVFDHGFGGGHRAYMKEIEMLCKHGYMVFAYDHTGCMESGGITPNGLAQSLCDLNDCIETIKKDDKFKGFDISVIGHSWGAFSTLNISALHPEISHIVAISGFVSVEEMVKTIFAGLLKGYRKCILELEKESNPIYFKYNAVDSLKNSNTKALLIYSENDKLCKKIHYDILKENLSDKENVDFLLVKNKGHNPNYTVQAVKLLEGFSKARAKIAKKDLTNEEKEYFVSSFDWEKMTTQDEEVWNIIFKHLQS